MSAECGKCGSDLTYRDWPVGECQRCELEAERDGLRASLATIEAHAEVCWSPNHRNAGDCVEAMGNLARVVLRAGADQEGRDE